MVPDTLSYCWTLVCADTDLDGSVLDIESVPCRLRCAVCAAAFALAGTAIAPLRAKSEQQGLPDFSPLWSGQNATGCREIPAAELTRELANG